jgi:alanyl aminopeptidase
MRWWDDLWLNESFATWMAYVTMQNWNPEFGFDREMVRDGHQVMNQDIFVETRPIREPIEHNNKIEAAFDGITYQKGGAMLQMFEAYVGAENFKQGVRFHMQKYAFGNANADEFLESIERFAAGKNIKQAFNSFLNQNGVPLVRMQYQCSNNKTEITLQQQRYLPIGARSSAQRIWSLPVCLNVIGQENNSKHCTLMTETTKTLSLDTEGCPLAVMPNAGGKGYYRWSLNPGRLNDLLANKARLSAAEQFALTSTLAAEFDAGRLSVNRYISAVEPFASANEWDLVTQPVSTIKYISDHIASGEQQKQLQQYLSQLYQPALKRVGLAADTPFDQSNPNDAKMLREEVLELMAMELEQPQLLQQLSTMASAYIGFNGDNKLHPEAIDPETIGIALASGVMVQGMPFVEALLAIFEETDDGTTRQRILVAIASSEDLEVSEKVLSLLTSLSLRVNERITLLISHMQRKGNMKRVYEWIKGNFGVVEMIIPSRYLMMSPMVAIGFCDQQMHQDANDFFSPKLEDVPGMDKTLSKVLEKIEICAAIAKNQKEKGLSL